MIRMGRGTKTDEPTTPGNNNYTTGAQPSYQYQSEAVAAPSRAITDSESMARDIKEGRLSGFVGHGTVLTGETNFEAMLRVDGHLMGTVASDSGTLLVGTNGQVDANISVAAALVNGNVNGDIVATEKIQLGRTARVVGNITTPRLILEDGAVLEGSCSMVKAKEAQEHHAAETESHYRGTEYSTAVEDDEEEEETETLFDSTVEADEDEEEETAGAATI
ncbi:MAG TPA: polymer-forming cytoskeletal protein [Pyrinomonadaceae bacterium]|nr:polymer-forming cytoskeletal protein [Pyrinomonadaceae bacterium]